MNQEKDYNYLVNIRDNVKFSNNVVVMPLIGMPLSGLLHAAAKVYREACILYAGEACWIEKGDKIMEYKLRTKGIFGKDVNLPIYSPVSGRVLSPGTAFGTSISRRNVQGFYDQEMEGEYIDPDNPYYHHFAIQIPEGESVNVDTSYSYGAFIHKAIEHREKLFCPPRYGSTAASPDELLMIFNSMRDQNFKSFELKENHKTWIDGCINERVVGIYGGVRLPSPNSNV